MVHGIRQFRDLKFNDGSCSLKAKFDHQQGGIKFHPNIEKLITRLWTADRITGVQFPAGTETLLHSVEIDSVAHPVSYRIGHADKGVKLTSHL
jgi:hypothetical protein